MTRSMITNEKPTIGSLTKRGFSLIELLITISIISILAMMVAPTMSEGIENSNVKALSGDFKGALSLAQSEAIKRGIQIGINPQQSNGNEWQQGWNIFADLNSNGSQDAGEELIRTYSIDNERLTLISRDSIFASWLAYTPSGAVRGNNGISGGFRICRSDGNAAKSRTFTIQATGNVISEVGASSCP